MMILGIVTVQRDVDVLEPLNADVLTHTLRVKHQRHALKMGLARSTVVVLVISELSNVSVILVKERVPRRPRCIYMPKDDRREK